MYGIFIEGLKHYVDKVFGADVWWAIVVQVTGQRKVLQSRQVYGDSFFTELIDALSELLNEPRDEILFELGCYFIQYLIDVGFNSLLHVLGAEFVDFLHNLDDLHHQLQFSYPRLRPPAFVVLNKTETEIRLLYESRRSLFTPFVRGQLVSVAQAFYDLDIDVETLNTETHGSSQKVTFLIRNKNGEWPEVMKLKREELLQEQKAREIDVASLQPNAILKGETFFSLFPYYLVISEDMKIVNCGSCYARMGAELTGKQFHDCFLISRPNVKPNLATVWFELILTFFLFTIPLLIGWLTYGRFGHIRLYCIILMFRIVSSMYRL